MSYSQYSTCRVCHVMDAGLFKYGTRHYAHADCALKKWGAGFFDRLSGWQLGDFPVKVAEKAGLGGELKRRMQP